MILFLLLLDCPFPVVQRNDFLDTHNYLDTHKIAKTRWTAWSPKKGELGGTKLSS